jgi:hypothetical protein
MEIGTITKEVELLPATELPEPVREDEVPAPEPAPAA